MKNSEKKPETEIKSVKVNPKIYPLDVVYSAAYIMMDKAYIVLDGDPEKEIEVRIKSKGFPLEKLAEEFNQELLNYAVYKTQSEKNSGIRQAMIQRALLTNGFEIEQKTEEKEDDSASIDDPEGIAVPWEEKYGKEDEGNLAVQEKCMVCPECGCSLTNIDQYGVKVSACKDCGGIWLSKESVESVMNLNPSSTVSKDNIQDASFDECDDPEGIAVPWEEKYGKN